MFASYETTTINPNFDPANPDLRLAAALQSLANDNEREAYRRLIQDKLVRRSLNFTNVRRVKLNKEARANIYDIENFSVTYAYSEGVQTNFNLQEDTRRSVRGAVAWQYSPKFTGFEPFKDSKLLEGKYLQLIKDFNFNPLPSNISVRGELDRSFNKIVYRNASTDAFSSLPNFQKFFVFNRFYTAKWSLTKTLTIDYNARVNAIIDEPAGDIDTPEKQDSIRANLRRLGRMKNFEQTITANYTLPLEKIPFTNWIGADYRYNVGYSWRAAPVEQVDTLRLGNTIQNTQEQVLSGRVDFLKLYNKVGFLKDINTPKKPLSPLERARQEKEKAKADTVKQPPDLGALKGILRLLMAVRNVNGAYNITQGTILPGFNPSPHLGGMDRDWNAPGWDFVLGGQDPNIRFRAADRGWLSASGNLTTPFSQVQQRDISARAAIEPNTDFKIQLDLKKTTNSAYQEIFRFDSTANQFASLSPSRTGAYKISILTINTAFKNNASLTSEAFQAFERNIGVMRDRFTLVNGGGYESQSQDVLIPAFIAAYTGKDANTAALTPFPNIPIPNWRLDYTGLSKLEALKDIFQSVTLNHAYSSTYTVTNFSNSLKYTDVGINNPLSQYNSGQFANQFNEQGELIPIYVISNVMISEQFSPLIGINVRTKTKLTARFEYKTKRDLSLNISNAQVTELNSKDWSVEVGYTKNNLRLPIRDQGRIITLKNDVTFRLNMAVTNSQTIQRKILEEANITNGNINFQLRPNISYVVSQKLNIQLYLERNVNEPLVTNSFRRATTRFGTKILYNLAQ
jgi:cell surface protein SprA